MHHPPGPRGDRRPANSFPTVLWFASRRMEDSHVSLESLGHYRANADAVAVPRGQSFLDPSRRRRVAPQHDMALRLVDRFETHRTSMRSVLSDDLVHRPFDGLVGR